MGGHSVWWVDDHSAWWVDDYSAWVGKGVEDHLKVYLITKTYLICLFVNLS